MTNYNPIFKSDQVISFVEQLICQYKYKSFSYLSYGDKTSFAGLIMKAGNDKDCLGESCEYPSIMDAYIEFLTTQTSESRIKFLDFMEANARIHYEKTMEGIFNEIFEEMEVSKRDRNNPINDNDFDDDLVLPVAALGSN